jgi:ABC-type Na+ efflux pump permease subunit
MKTRPSTWGTTATLTQGGVDRSERMAYIGGALLVACLVAQVMGAVIPEAAYYCILGLFGGGALVAGSTAAFGARAHASQYQDPTARRPVAGRFSPDALDPADRPHGAPGEVD